MKYTAKGSEAMSLIELKKVSKSFEQKDGQIQALKEISLSIEESDIYGIIGMSGAGKSTLVRCLNYLERPTSGSVVIDGKDLSTLSGKELRQERESISMIFQHFNLLMQKNVLDNVCFPLRLKKIKKKEAQEKALQLLETVGLKEKAKAYPSQLSGGQKQRVAIARALASNPKILLCDEATSALDPQTTEAILKLLKQIHKEYGITIVIITHQMSVIQEICNKVAIIEGGELVEEGRVDEIFARPRSRAAKQLIFGNGDADSSKKPLIFENGSADGTEQRLLSENADGTRPKQTEVPVVEEIKAKKKIRAVFSENSAFEPVIANMVLQFQAPVNILRADTKNVGGIAKGEIILGLPEDEELQNKIVAYLEERGLTVQEVTSDV